MDVAMTTIVVVVMVVVVVVAAGTLLMMRVVVTVITTLIVRVRMIVCHAHLLVLVSLVPCFRPRKVKVSKRSTKSELLYLAQKRVRALTLGKIPPCPCFGLKVVGFC